jgi:hypothetical protein
MTRTEWPVDEAEAADKYYEVTSHCITNLKTATIMFNADEFSGIHDISSRFLNIHTAAKLIKSLSWSAAESTCYEHVGSVGTPVSVLYSVAMCLWIGTT